MGWAFFAVLLIRIFCIAPLEVTGDSMSPLLNGNGILSDRVLYNRLAYRFLVPKRGDIVVFEETDPVDPYKKIKSIRRIAALPGEKVYIRNGKLFINDKPLEDSFFKDQDYPFRSEAGMTYGEEAQPVKIPEGSYYLLGDNPEKSRDSRHKGCVSRLDLAGRVFFRYWPFSRWGWIRFSGESDRENKKGAIPSKEVRAFNRKE